MGYIRHNAIIATGWQDEALAALLVYANGIGANAALIPCDTNGYSTVCIGPDGSKEGWERSAEGDEQRRQIKAWFEAHPDWYFEWREVAYGNDDGRASIVESAWESENQPSLRP